MAPVELLTADSVTLRGWIWCPPRTPRAAVVLVHGFVGSGQSDILQQHAEALLDDGFAVLSFDTRGHGESGGSCTLGARERLDVKAAVERARGLADPVVVVGESAGGVAVLNHACVTGDVAGVVTVGSPGSWTMKPNLRTAAATALTQTSAGRWVADRLMNVTLHPRRVRMPEPSNMASRLGVPLAVVHGRNDPFIPVAEARLLHESASGPVRLDLVPDMSHGFGEPSVPVVREAIDWILTHQTN